MLAQRGAVATRPPQTPPGEPPTISFRRTPGYMIRLLSYNIHKGIGGRDRRYRLERILGVLEAERPDVICLQEVDRHVRRSRHDDQPELLARWFGAIDRAYQLNVRLREGGYGNLILSRFPFREHHHVSLRLRSKKPRGAQLAVIDTPFGSLHLVHWHLGLAESERAWQVNHLLCHTLFQQSARLPTVIVGDFNDWRNRLAGDLLEPAGFAQATRPISRFRSFPAYLPLASLDKAFCRGLTVHRAFVSHQALARQASDHLPLVLDLELPALAP